MFFIRFFPVLTKLKALKNHGRMLWHAFKHADTPKWIKGIMLAVVLYLFSPIDLVPDFLVLFGITDDLIIISSAMWFLGKVIPEKVKNSLPMTESNMPHAGMEPMTKPVKQSTASNPSWKSDRVKSLGLLILLALLFAALASHPWVHAQFESIGAFF